MKRIMLASARGVVLSISAIALSTLYVPPASACTLSEKPARSALITLAPAAALAPSPAAGAATPEGKAKSRSIVGLWKADTYYQGQLVDQGFDTFHTDGTELLIDTSAPATDNVCAGVWEQTAPATIKLKHPSWFFDLNGNLLGIAIIRETLTVDWDDDSFKGSWSSDAYDLAGNLLNHGQGELRANASP
jgi:hypothetical protein